MFRVEKPSYLTPSATYNYKVVLFEKIPALCMQNFPSFPECETLFVVDCDKNFVFHHIKQKYFPKVTLLFLYSHPCEPCVLHREFPKIYLAERHAHYKERWASEKENLFLITREHLEREITNQDKIAKLQDKISYLERRKNTDSCQTQ